MFEASVDGQAYDTERWGAYYRPRGVSAPAGGATAAPAAQPTQNFGQMTTAAPVAQSAPVASAVAEDEDLPFTPDPVVEEAPAPTAPVTTPAAVTLWYCTVTVPVPVTVPVTVSVTVTVTLAVSITLTVIVTWN
jgi:hypothetical protein